MGGRVKRRRDREGKKRSSDGESKRNWWGKLDVAKMSKPDDCLQVDGDVLR